MRIEPLGACDIGAVDWSNCRSLNSTSSTGRNNAVDLFGAINGSGVKSTDVFGAIASTRQVYDMADQISFDPAFINIYLQYPNEKVAEIANKIVKPYDSDDVKMEKIQRAVVKGIRYETDQEQYGYEELWVPPLQTLQSGKGDCEDGAFLIMSLALNAGVDPSRLRMYGGFVDAGPGAASGGHGWVAYKRESDNEWVAADYSYYPDLRPMDVRTPLREDDKYVDDYFYMTNKYYVSTPFTNRIKNPEGMIYSRDATIPNIFKPQVGSMLSQYG
jgi:predicted transglutaminase-like cysteine proteinase